MVMCIAFLSFTVVKQKKYRKTWIVITNSNCVFLVFKSQVVPWCVSDSSHISISLSPLAIKAELEKNTLGAQKVSNIKLVFYL